MSRILALATFACVAGAQTQNNFATFTISGTVPDGALFATIGPRVNIECNCTPPGYADIVIASASYSENGGAELLSDPDFLRWGGLSPAGVREPAPNGGFQLHFTVTPATFSQANSGYVPVKAGASYKVTFLARVTPQSVGNGYFSIFFLTHAFIQGQPSGEIRRDTVDLQSTIFGLSPSQSGFTIQAVAGGGMPAPRTFALLNGLQSSIDYTLTTTTAGGSSWLSATPTGGTLLTKQGIAPTLISVQANPGSLAAGTYYGQVVITAPKAPNSPQIVSVVLVVAPSTATPPPEIAPTGVVFTAVAGGTNPAPQTMTVTNLVSKPVAISVGSALNPASAVQISPPSATVAPNQPLQIQLTPNIAGLAAGIYRGTLDVFVAATSTNIFVDVLLVIAPGTAASAPSASFSSRAAAGSCAPAKLLPVFTLLGQSFSVSAAWPSAVAVKVVDDCGAPQTSGSVVVSFSNGDPPLSLLSLGTGEWNGTWAPAKPVGANLAVTANAINGILSGTAKITGAALSNPNVPVVTPGGVVSAASYSATASPSPGEIVSIFGSNLAPKLVSATTVPLDTQLGGVTVVMAGRALPLIAVSPNVINAVIPYDVPAGGSTQLIVSQGTNLSLPTNVPVAPAEPGIFTIDASGSGQGHIYVLTPAGGYLAAKGSPAKPGDSIVIYCSGLGAVTAPATAGSPTPSDAYRNTQATVLLTIGGVKANVLFAGLTPTATDLYQVNATIPAGVTPGDSVPVILTAGGYGGAPVTIAVAGR